MEQQKKRTWVEINLSHLKHNVSEMRKQLPDSCRYLGVVKANAYGHGAVQVAKCLEEMEVAYLAVACLDEAIELREAGVHAKILILGPSLPEYAPTIAQLGNVCQAVGSYRLAQAFNDALEGTDLILPVHIKLETGMGRTGFDVRKLKGLEDAKNTMSLEHLEIRGVFTHFAVSDELGDPYTWNQYTLFTQSIEWLEQESGEKFLVRHCTNSAAMVNYPQMYMDMVRPGLAQYGLYPAGERGALELKPVMSLKTRVVEITEHEAGESISYGRTYTCPDSKRFAVLPIGYADGLPRSLSGQFSVVIGGKPAPQCGRICMDMCMVDITDLPEVQVGDEVEIFGEQQSVDVLAEVADTISYELLCAVSPRVPRVYLEN